MKFLAFLRDSYREAVDGFVIYVMLGLSALVIVLAASMSFTPVEPDKAFPQIASEFHTAFRNRGEDRHPVGPRFGDGFGATTLGFPCEYSVSEVQRVDAGGGTYKMRLTAKPGRLVVVGGPLRGQVLRVPQMPQNDASAFRLTVAAWAQQPPKEDRRVVLPPPEDFGPQPKGGKKRVPKGDDPEAPPVEVQVMFVPDVSDADARAVKDETMTDFIRNQFLLHGGMDQVTVTRVSGVAEPDYLFEVEVKGGSSARGWPHATNALFGAIPLSNGPLGDGLLVIEDRLVNGIGGGIAILVTVILTAFFIPNLLRKGSLELILSKPVGRGELLVYKFVGGLTFMFLISTITIGGVWLALSVRSGYWNPVFLLSIPMLTFAFAILYSLSTLLGFLTRNAIVCILLTSLFMALLWGVGQLKWVVDVAKASVRNEADFKPTTFSQVLEVLHAILPRYNDADAILSRRMGEGALPVASLRTMLKYQADPPAWGPTYGVSLAFIALMLLLAYWRFKTRDG